MDVRISDLINAIDKTLRKKFDGRVLSFVFDSSLEDTIQTPCIITSIDEFTEGYDYAVGEEPLLIELCAYCILSNKTPQKEIRLREFAAELLTVVKRNTWGIEKIGLPENLQSAPGVIKSGPNGYDSWYVRWFQQIEIGDFLWHDFDPSEKEIMLGVEPKVGIDHVDDYVKIG